MTTAINFLPDESDDASLSLTTIFTPPSPCSTHWTYEASLYNSALGGLLLQNALASPLDAACFPPGFTNYGRASQSQIYSPGHCPVGYTTPAQYLNDVTTTLICCQTSFTYFSTLTTIDNIFPTTAVNFAGCISTYPKSSGATTVPARANDTDLLPSTTLTGPLTMWGQPIEVAFRQQDLSLYTTSTSALASQTNIQPPSNPVTQAPPSTIHTSVPSNDSGLSTGAKAGIGIGVAGVGLALFGFALFLLRRRRRTARSGEQHLMGTFSESKEKEILCREEDKERLQPAGAAELEILPSAMPDEHRVPVAELESKDRRPLVEQE